MQYKQVINNSQVKYKNFLLNIEKHFKNSNQTIHKARNELKTITIRGNDYIVKSFKIPHLLNCFIYSFFRNSKAKKSYDNAIRVKEFTPEPIGYIEFYKYGLLHESYFVSEEFKYDFTIREPLLDANFQDKEEIFRAFARFTLKLHNTGIFHDDYSPGNILIKRENSTLIFKIVDINRMKFLKLSEDLRAKNFSKLWANDEILKIMAEEYSKHCDCSEKFTEKVLYHSNKNKKIKNFKKRLKGKPVND